ncbi:retropepsin-like aspartic protease [Streptomyces peucetius]|uniref:Retropepsin-like domain-containing protein n=1 Tax=Streptomyces peucetius TaxID=1950 RepID=A0ABY6I0S8_STRPE|nr:retropepsin-like aspartic protease [Streptomyces peucetius]UYQ60441.1 retropepsin-like domain-containing protein [Streptomyces peucetius]
MSRRHDSDAAGMRHQRASRLAAGPLAALLLSGCILYEDRDDRDGRQMSPGAVREVPLRVVEQGGQSLAFVPVSVEGEGPFMFALDTGASSSVVDDDVADRAGLDRTGEHRSVSGILGTGQVPVARVEQWKVGDVPIGPGEVTVIDLGPPRGSGGIQGLLGSDVLRGFGSITVDYDDGVLKVGAP